MVARDSYAVLLLAESIEAKDSAVLALVEKVSKGEDITETVTVMGKAVKVTKEFLEIAAKVAHERLTQGFAGEPDVRARPEAVAPAEAKPVKVPKGQKKT